MHSAEGVGRGGGGQRDRMRRSGESAGRGIRVGTKVAALMAAWARTITAAKCRVHACSVTNVASIESDLPGGTRGDTGSYATAWTCLFRNLELVKGQTLVSRGRSSFGQAALNGGKWPGQSYCHNRRGDRSRIGGRSVQTCRVRRS